MTCPTLDGITAVDMPPHFGGDELHTDPNEQRRRIGTSVAEAELAAAPVRAVAVALKPPRGGMVDFGLTDAGMLVIFNPECMDADYAIELVALITELDLVNVDSEATP